MLFKVQTVALKKKHHIDALKQKNNSIQHDYSSKGRETL